MHFTTHLLAALAASACAVSASAQCSNFLGSCSGMELRFLGDNGGEPWLHANGGCGDNNGGKSYGFFDLNSKFTNHNGNLAQSDEGGFGHSCRNIRYENGVLTAECGDNNGGTPTTSINLNEYICNINGQLECF
ncbi:Cyanovirin-N [Akanthomyces lecanii RCEF 1005]|uniref:Cyanovirin-N n=1 Tax=Akanthomyces lecanii RCEF 1005 TaxID=1081108 RepID=A0A162MYK2_CORDF|nr:Cyanovirin-N [Akanthomyces lecanii RCEF 1005]